MKFNIREIFKKDKEQIIESKSKIERFFNLKLLGFILISLFVFNNLHDFLNGEYSEILWSCDIIFLFLILATYLRSGLLALLILPISIFTQIPWLIDGFNYLVFNHSDGHMNWLINNSVLLTTISSTIYHTITIPVEIYLVYKYLRIVKYRYLFFGIIFCVSYAVILLNISYKVNKELENNLNCVFYPCNIHFGGTNSYLNYLGKQDVSNKDLYLNLPNIPSIQEGEIFNYIKADETLYHQKYFKQYLNDNIIGSSGLFILIFMFLKIQEYLILIKNVLIEKYKNYKKGKK